MDMSKRFVMIGAVVVFVLGFSNPCLSQDDQDLVIRTYLFKADIQGAKLSKKDLAAFLDSPPLLSLHRGSGRAGGDDFETMGRMIGSLYRVPNLVFLTSADMRWEGGRDNINETIKYGIDIYPIQIYRRSVSPASVRLKIEALRFEISKMFFTDTRTHIKRAVGLDSSYQLFGDTERIADPVGGVKWLDAEISIPIGSAVIVALPTDEPVLSVWSSSSVFCALKATRTNDKNMEIGFQGERILSLVIGGTDPVCGKAVIKGNEAGDASELKASLVHNGEFYYFCSEDCLAKFQADPDRYLKKAAFRRNIAAASAGPVAPRPKLAIAPEMPPAAAGGRLPAFGRAEFDLDGQGRIAGIRTSRSEDPVIDRTLREALDQWRFAPRKENGMPVASTYAANITVSAGDAIGETDRAVESEPGPGRPAILAKAAEYCRKLENAALYFVCREKIVETINPSDELEILRMTVEDRIDNRGHVLLGSTGFPSGENTSVYDFQLTRKDGRIREKRALIGENASYTVSAQAYPKTRRFFIDRAVLGPVGLFGREAHSLFQYRVIDERTLDGKPVDVVEVKPNNASAQRSVYGKAWVEKKTGAILKMEIDAESFSGYERIWAEYSSQGFRPSVSFEIAYGFENGGLCYPSRIRLKESVYGVRVSELTVDYDRYKFFTVGTEVIIK